jgi:hypothetical protein
MSNNAVLEVDLDELDMKVAARVAQRFVLREIFLVDAKISRDPLIESHETLSLEHKCSTEVPDGKSNAGEKSYLCNFRVAAFDGKEPNKLVMKIEASFCTSYVSNPDIHMPDDLDVDSILSHLEYMMTINPISTAWPYWREFVQSMSARMGFPALTVPLLEIVVKKTATQEPKNQPVKKQASRRKKVNV